MYGGEHLCRAESRANVRSSFSAGGPASRDAHLFYVRSEDYYGAHFFFHFFDFPEQIIFY